MDWLKGLALDLWWNKLIAVGVALVVAALAAGERDLMLIGLGMLALGFGESLNHKKLIEFTPPNAYVPQGIVTSYPRLPNAIGYVLDAIGIGLMVFGVYRLLAT